LESVLSVSVPTDTQKATKKPPRKATPKQQSINTSQQKRNGRLTETGANRSAYVFMGFEGAVATSGLAVHFFTSFYDVYFGKIFQFILLHKSSNCQYGTERKNKLDNILTNCICADILIIDNILSI